MRRFVKYSLLLMLVLGVSVSHASGNRRPLAPFLGEEAYSALDTALLALNMLEEDLAWQKGWGSEWETPRLLDAFHHQPLEGIRELHAMLDASIDPAAGWDPLYPLRYAAGVAGEDVEGGNLIDEINSAEPPEAPAFDNIPLELRYALAPLYRAVEISRSARARALTDLTREEQIALLGIAPLLWLKENEVTLDGRTRDVLTLLPGEGGIDEPTLARSLISFLSQNGPSPFNDQGKFETDTVLQSIRDYPDRAAERLMEICGKVDRAMLARSAEALWFGTYETARRLDTLGEQQWSAVHPLRLSERGDLGLWGDILVLDESFAGYKLVIGGKGDNAYRDQHNTLLIDLGGDDRYVGRCGGAIGGLALLADLGGDDLYQGRSRWVTQGGAMLGVSLLYDRAGEDVYLADNFAQGSAIAGAALLLDHSETGDDYSAGMHSQAFAMGGWACLHDEFGGNSLSAGGWSQGVGGYLGSALLSGSSGDDVYRITGEMPGQGVGAALPGADAPGGVGLLLEPGGNDDFDAPSGQGAGIGPGLGVLIDRTGDDDFDADERAQGWATGVGVGVLIDCHGVDMHQIRYSGGLGSGEHFGCGIFIDKLGDDRYMLGSQACGVGALGGLGLFVDEAGDDLYAPFEQSTSLGAGVIAPGHDSLGLFLDLNGNDVYTAFGERSDWLWTKGGHGCGLDVGPSSREASQ